MSDYNPFEAKENDDLLPEIEDEGETLIDEFQQADQSERNARWGEGGRDE